MKKALLVLIMVIAASLFSVSTASANSWRHPHPGWQHNPRNPHYVVFIPQPPLGHCSYTIGVCTNSL